ncbi:helix-turn-helix domain-containing protein [Mucilaginibacter ginsenosidivorax]|uniref:Helix-turn-helix transcriptional regulator n=1 Tax=Mucilaginibacter ginsenosidivorax TaxID=862126 RepID=A0A5B8W7I1_9SPHI|nr:helix-turn-helix domain-containing protein [Mucilaginibacter ginsenosidivorax]QEC78862.1 helix-turn-helix transcriptional regulator [Mucilaginibacter ginsenosidivorax]
METATKGKILHIGRKIERVRKLRGLTQEEVGTGLGITKQAVSKLEQSEIIDEERLEQIATVLGVTLEGLKRFNDETVLNNNHNFYDSSSVTHSSINNGYEFTIINNPIEKIIELYESLLKVEREKVEILRNKNINQ